MNKYLQWMSKETPTIWWHDSADVAELEAAMENGAVGVTTNPFLVNATLRAKPDFWSAQGVKPDPSVKGQDKAEAMIKGVTTYLGGRMVDFSQEWGKGLVCAQLNPKHVTDEALMVEQAKRYASWFPNVSIKLPATRAGIRALEECAALGFNVTCTVSFTVPQVLAAGAAYQRGIERAKANGIKPGLGIAVLMVGRLDDYLRDVMNDSDCDASESDIIWAGTAAIKRAYNIFNERGYACALMPAGCRGAYHISELGGARMIMSISPKIATMLEAVTDLTPKIDNPVDPAIIRRLQTMPEFIKAYEPNGMSESEFITYGSTNRTLTQFIECGWNPLEAL